MGKNVSPPYFHGSCTLWDSRTSTSSWSYSYKAYSVPWIFIKDKQIVNEQVWGNMSKPTLFTLSEVWSIKSNQFHFSVNHGRLKDRNVLADLQVTGYNFTWNFSVNFIFASIVNEDLTVNSERKEFALLGSNSLL